MIDLFLPDSDASCPVVIFIHGGAWMMGDRKLAPDLTRYFAQHGFAMASIDYRLSGQAIFPAQVHDVKAAIRWLRAHASDYNLDPDRIALWGASAGGHLASLTALAGDGVLEEDGWQPGGVSAEVAAVVEGYGPTDLLAADGQRKPIPEDEREPDTMRYPPGMTGNNPASPEAKFLGGPLESRADVAKAANPITYAHADAPPFMIMHGLSDEAVPSGQSIMLFEALRDQKANATLYLIDRIGHAFLNRNDFDQPPRQASVQRTNGSAGIDRAFGFETIHRFLAQHLRQG